MSNVSGSLIATLSIMLVTVSSAPNQIPIFADSISSDAYASPVDSARLDIITIGNSPCDIAVDDGGSKLFVSNYKADKVLIVERLTSHVIGEISVPGTPCALTPDPNSDAIYVISEFGNSIYSLDGSTHTIKSNFTFDRPYEMVVSAKTRSLYVTSDANDRVFALDPASGSVVSTFEIADPCGIAIDQVKDVVYVSSESTGQVYVIDGTANTIVATIPVEQGPRGLAFNEKTNTLFVANTRSASVTTIDAVENKAIGTVKVNDPPRNIAVNPNTNIAYLISASKHTLSYFDPSTNSIIESAQVQAPYEVVVDANSNVVYVSSFGSNFVYTIKGYEREVSTAPLSLLAIVIVIAVLAGGGGVATILWRRNRGQNSKDKRVGKQ